MRFLTVLFCMLIACGSAVAGDTMIQLQFEVLPLLQSTVAITEAAPIAVTNAAKYSDALLVGGDGSTSMGRLYLALMYDVDVSSTLSAAVTIQVSADGTTFYDVLPSNAFTITVDEVAVRAISIPACKYIRIKFAKDASDTAYDVDLLRIWRL